MNTPTSENTTHFGFADVPTDAKQGMVKNVFKRVAPSYDLMNDAMSVGLHRDWKDRLIDVMAPRENHKLLDVAGGTGDVSFRFLKAGGGQVTVCDINEAMLHEGRARAIDENITAHSHNPQPIDFVLGNAESLPFESGLFDTYNIAFGIRNVTHIDRALKEAHRVLKYGGHFLCLEFSQPTHAALRTFYDAYSFKMIPKMGKLLADDEDSYQYLVESIRQFPKQDRFAKMIEEAGFSRVSYTNLSGGIVAIHSGWKL